MPPLTFGDALAFLLVMIAAAVLGAIVDRFERDDAVDDVHRRAHSRNDRSA